MNKKYDCVLQTGGSDQWGNITAGVDLIRRVLAKQVHALTTPLMVKADGNKFGKTEEGTIWLSPELTSPYSFYQFWLNSDDRDMEHLLKYFSLANKDKIEELLSELKTKPADRSAQKFLAQELTTLVHGIEDTNQVIAASNALFGQGELENISKDILISALTEAGLTKFTKTINETTIIELLVETKLCDSKSSAKRTIDEGGAYVNNQRITDINWKLSQKDLIHGSILVIRRGKKSMAGAIF